MKIYNYDKYNGIYTGESMADESPLEPGEYLKPAYSTEIPPLKPKSGKEISFDVNADKWVYIDLPTIAENDPREFMIVSAFQAHAAVARLGIYENIELFMSQDSTPVETRLAWDKAQEFKRLSPTVISIGEALGLTNEQLDDIFELASTIQA